MKILIATFVLMLMSVFAHAESMSCYIGVSKAADIIKDPEMETLFQVVEVPLVNGKGSLDIQLNGESVNIAMFKRPYADVYEVLVALTTPVADRVIGTNFVALGHEFLINEGPAKVGSGPNVKNDSVNFEYINNQSGFLVVTQKLKTVMIKNGLWGKFPYTNVMMSITNSIEIKNVIEKLVNKGDLSLSDVVLLQAAYSCTYNK